MKDKDQPIVHIPTLRRDLYLVMSLLLADKEVNKLPKMVDWTQDFYETEVRRLLLWIAVAIRGLLDLSKRSERKRDIENQICGEYWPNFISDQNPQKLTFRQACNSVIHAREILTYKISESPDMRADDLERSRAKRFKPPKSEFAGTVTHIYHDRVTIAGIRRKKGTRAQLDIIKFVQVAYTMSNFIEEGHHADK